MLFDIIYLFIYTLSLSFVFVACGYWALSYSISLKAEPVLLRISMSYFMGMSIFLSLWRCIAFIFKEAQISLIVAICIIFVISLFALLKFKDTLSRYCISIYLSKKKFMSIVIIISSLFYLFSILYWLWPYKEIDIYSMVGSLHSGRYASVANFVVDNNFIPRINQNYGQSMLVAVSLFAGQNMPLLALNLWLSNSLIFLTMMVYGLFIKLLVNKYMALFGTIIVMLGNTALSLTHVLVIDSGSPLILNGYTDTIFSIGSFIIFLFFLNGLCRNKINSSPLFYALLVMLYISWGISAPQNIILSILSILVIIPFIFKKLYSFKMPIIIIFASAIISCMFGGMLTPKSMQDNINIPGLMSVSTQKNSGIRPILPHHYGAAGTWKFGGASENTLIKEQIVNLKHEIDNKEFFSAATILYDLYYQAERNFIDSFRITFFPVLGILGLIYFLIRRKIDYENYTLIKIFLIFGILTFCCGFSIAFFIQKSGYKWELSRFMILGYSIGLFAFAIVVDAFIKNMHSSKKILICAGIIFLMTIGPITNSIFIVKKNVDSKHSIAFTERLKILINDKS